MINNDKQINKLKSTEKKAATYQRSFWKEKEIDREIRLTSAIGEIDRDGSQISNVTKLSAILTMKEKYYKTNMNWANN